jgi:hypothetical protein
MAGFSDTLFVEVTVILLYGRLKQRRTNVAYFVENLTCGGERSVRGRREVLQHSANRIHNILPVGSCAAHRSCGNSAPKSFISSSIDKIHQQGSYGRTMHVTGGNRRSAPKGIGTPTGTTRTPTAPVVECLHGYLFAGGYVILHIKIRPSRSAEPSGR